MLMAIIFVAGICISPEPEVLIVLIAAVVDATLIFVRLMRR